jgi:hypothetical protein
MKGAAAILATFVLVAFWLVALQFRIISLPFLLLWICLLGSYGWHKRNWLIVAGIAVFFLSTFSPVDLYVPGWSGPHFGKARPGTRLVRQVKGMPMISRCEEKYGEFIAGGCCVKGYEAPWLLVLAGIAEPDGPANRSQRVPSGTTQASGAAGSGR